MSEEDLKKLSVLFVDDESIQRMLMENILKRSFKDVSVAEDAKDALTQYETNKFDLIITDFTMPKMNGCQLITEIKKQNDNQRCVILTANDPNELRDDFGCTAPIIRKPFKRTEGIASLVEILS